MKKIIQLELKACQYTTLLNILIATFAEDPQN